MSSIQLSFSLRVSSGVKTVHLLGSWDGYQGQLPLSKDKTSSKSGSWKGTFRFQGATLEPGQRYWYYYIIDGYHVSHNPSEKSTVEPQTGRELNILDVSKDAPKSSKSSSSSSSKRSSRHSSSSSSKERKSLSVDIPKGRPLSVSQIRCPKPVSPRTNGHILGKDFDENSVDELSQRFGSADISAAGYDSTDEDIITDFGGLSESPASSVSSYRSGSSSPSSQLSGYSTPGSDCSSCTCERYGITRKGERVRLDCGGARCGFSDEDESDCSSGSEAEYDDEVSPASNSSRRHGMVVRA